jgi:hypothetical protein
MHIGVGVESETSTTIQLLYNVGGGGVDSSISQRKGKKKSRAESRNL